MKPILITTGEPAGIGMDIVLDVLCHHRDVLPSSVLILADKRAFDERALQLQSMGKLSHLPAYHDCDEALCAVKDGGVYLLNIPCHDKVIAGELNPNNAHMVKAQLDMAHHLASSGKVGAIVTAPLQKSVMVDAGICLENGEMFCGHTEYFMHKSGCDKVVMMLANTKMKVALVTTHLPLKDVPNAITAQAVSQTVRIVHDEMQSKFQLAKPKILVCGLNPHAGEDGHLGDEEKTIINPVLMAYQQQGLDISLALPADTLFTEKHLQSADVVIAMYHDQGLAPLKSHGFGDTVNITLGLPYVRTSVDHGTALDLSGTGRASSSSLVQAIIMATATIAH